MHSIGNSLSGLVHKRIQIEDRASVDVIVSSADCFVVPFLVFIGLMSEVIVLLRRWYHRDEGKENVRFRGFSPLFHFGMSVVWAGSCYVCCLQGSIFCVLVRISWFVSK